jgi:chemotaxis protein CheD
MNATAPPSGTYLLHPGFLYYAHSDEVIQTVVGSAVSVCIWDQVQCCGAANHYRYAQTPRGTAPSALYGDASIMQLLRLLRDNGSRKADLVAQIYGGAFPDQGRGRDVGSENIELARHLLRELRVPVIAEDVGGTVGRKIIFDLATGHIGVLKVHAIRGDDWAPEVWGRG